MTVETIHPVSRAGYPMHLMMARPAPFSFDKKRDLAELVDSLSALPHKPTTRVVFDEGRPAADYVHGVRSVRKVSYVMGELVDSHAFSEVTLNAYAARASEYLAALGSDVDIWEVGNEINGGWLGDASEVAEKMAVAYDKVKAAGKPAALTLYYNEGCAEPGNEMFEWAAARIPERMKKGLDYVLVSYYEDDCGGRQPDWDAVFTRLGKMFPEAKLGIGECGTADASRKAEFIKRYYGMKLSAPRFVGGFFWWYYLQDMVPRSRPLFKTLSDALR